MKQGIFLDRDGTIIEDRGHLSSINDVHIYPNTVWSLKQLKNNFELFIVTHQPGVSRGLLTMNDVEIHFSKTSDSMYAAFSATTALGEVDALLLKQGGQSGLAFSVQFDDLQEILKKFGVPDDVSHLALAGE